MNLNYIYENPNLPWGDEKPDHLPFGPALEAIAALDYYRQHPEAGECYPEDLYDILCSIVRREIGRDLQPMWRQLYTIRDGLTATTDEIKGYLNTAMCGLLTLGTMANNYDWSKDEFTAAVCGDGVDTIQETKLALLNAMSAIEDTGNAILQELNLQGD